jgi:hypothetical protein
MTFINYAVPVDFPAGSIMVESVTTTKVRPGMPTQTKTRRFSCACLTVLAAKGLHPGDTIAKQVEGGKAASVVPFLIMLAGTHAQTQAVAANLRSGRRASLMSGATIDGYVELPAKAGYRAHTVRAGDGTTVLTLFLPWAVQRAPQERSESRVSIANIVPRWWLGAEVGKLLGQGMREEHAQHDAIAAWVVDRLDKAVSRPILADLGFRRFLFGKMVDQGAVAPFQEFTFGRPTMCWPKGSAAAMFAHATAVVQQVRELNDLVAEATLEWVGKNRANRRAASALAEEFGAELGGGA